MINNKWKCKYCGEKNLPAAYKHCPYCGRSGADASVPKGGAEWELEEMSPFDLKAIFEFLSSEGLMPSGRNKLNPLKLFFPQGEYITRDDVAEKYIKRKKGEPHWLLDLEEFDDSISFCALCECVHGIKAKTNYISYFCSQDIDARETEKSGTELAYVFLSMLTKSGRSADILKEMEARAKAFLDENEITPDSPVYTRIEEKLSAYITEFFAEIDPKADGSVPAAFYQSLEAALSRTLATAAIRAAKGNYLTEALQIIWADSESKPWRWLLKQACYACDADRWEAALPLLEQAYKKAAGERAHSNYSEYKKLIIQACFAQYKVRKASDELSNAFIELNRICEGKRNSARSEALYVRACCLEEGIGYACDSRQARRDLLDAAEEGSVYLPVYYKLGQACFRDHDLQEAYKWLQKGHRCGVAECSYYLACICENNRDVFHFVSDEDIECFYGTAAQHGIGSAKTELRKFNFKSEWDPVYEDGDVIAGQRVCFTNGLTGTYMQSFLSGTNFDRISDIGQYKDMGQMLIENAEALRSAEIVFTFFSQTRSNTQDVLKMFEYIIDYCVRFPEREDWRRMEIFVLSEEDSDSLQGLIDAVMSDLPDGIFFRYHIVDPARKDVIDLLSKHPVFSPCIEILKKDRFSSATDLFVHPVPAGAEFHIVIIGTNRFSLELAKQIVSCTYNFPTTIDVIGGEADTYRCMFEEDCPGLFLRDRSSKTVIPAFHACDPETIPVKRACVTDEEKRMRSAIESANYIVVCTESDNSNLKIGMKLRSNLLSIHPSKNARPSIAVRYRGSDAASGFLATQLAVQPSVDIRYSWTQKYALFIFGGSNDYTYHQLRTSMVERSAIALHKSYFDLQTAVDSDNAMRAYYANGYNRQSSIAEALSIPYMLFAFGIFFNDAYHYSIREWASLGKAFQQMLADRGDALIEEAAILEHDRWSNYMCSTGWEPADRNKYLQYITAGNNKHHFRLAKLHPYICRYEDLTSVWTELKTAAPARQFTNLSDPREADRAFVRKIPQLLEDK